MPLNNVNYSKTVIYKIVCNNDAVDYLYVGSTTDYARRKSEHKTCCNNANGKHYTEKKCVEMRANGGFDHFNIIEIEKYPCNDKREAESREEYHRKELNANMNSNRAFKKHFIKHFIKHMMKYTEQLIRKK